MAHFSPQEKRNLTWLTGWGFGVVLCLAAANLIAISGLLEGPQNSGSQRHPASRTHNKVFAHSPQGETFQWDCNFAQSKTLTTSRGHLRLVVNNCPGLSELKNLSNKSDGDLFPVSATAWTSDYIHLSAGMNRLQLRWEGGSQIIEVTRDKPDPKALHKEL